MPQPTARLAEIDLLRGIAILLMIIFHIVFDLAYFYHWPVDYLNGFWYYQGKAAAVLFMLVSGISCTLSRNSLQRGLEVLGTGLIITAVTYLLQPAEYIRFGILHLLGSAMLLAPWLKQYSALTLAVAGTVCIIAGKLTITLTPPLPWFIPLGITPPGFASLDYYPIFPWLGIVLYGLAAGKLLYPAKQPLWPGAALYRPAGWLGWLGRHSLPVYLVHQPLILAGLYLLYKL